MSFNKYNVKHNDDYNGEAGNGEIAKGTLGSKPYRTPLPPCSYDLCDVILPAERNRRPTIKAKEAAEQGKTPKGKGVETETQNPNQRRKSRTQEINHGGLVLVPLSRTYSSISETKIQMILS